MPSAFFRTPGVTRSILHGEAQWDIDLRKPETSRVTRMNEAMAEQRRASGQRETERPTRGRRRGR